MCELVQKIDQRMSIIDPVSGPELGQSGNKKPLVRKIRQKRIVQIDEMAQAKQEVFEIDRLATDHGLGQNIVDRLVSGSGNRLEQISECRLKLVAIIGLQKIHD